MRIDLRRVAAIAAVFLCTTAAAGITSADDWTTPGRPTSIATPAPSTTPAWSDSITTRSAEPAFRGLPPPPPPPPGGSAPVVVRPSAPIASSAPPPPPPPPGGGMAAPSTSAGTSGLSSHKWCGCGLPCEDGVSMWFARAVFGWAFFFGDDPADSCLYWGLDIGRTFCGCWGMSAFYRYNSGQFPRDNDPNRITKDGGAFHHVGVKFEYGRSFNKSKVFWWAGIGPEYWWTQDYIHDDSGFGMFGEAGLGYIVSQNFRIRAGVNLHAMFDANVGRKNAVDDGSGRLLWIVAPVIEAEVDF